MGGSFIQAQGDVTLGKKQRDEQYEIASNWEARGRPLMRGFDLSERNLSRLKLSGGDLREADLSGAVLRAADLCRVNLNRAKLSGANLARIDLSGAELIQANLGGAELIQANLSGARYNDDTQWPSGFDPVAAGAEKVD